MLLSTRIQINKHQISFKKENNWQEGFFFTGVLLKMGANGPEGLTPINFKIVFYEVSLWYMNTFKIFWSPDIVFPKKMTNFCLDLAFSHENLGLSQKVFWGNSCWFIFENTLNLIYKKSSILSFSYLKKLGVPHLGDISRACWKQPEWGTPIYLR